jgi:hypothetical protein
VYNGAVFEVKKEIPVKIGAERHTKRGIAVGLYQPQQERNGEVLCARE